MNVKAVCGGIHVYIHYIYNGEIPMQVNQLNNNATLTKCFLYCYKSRLSWSVWHAASKIWNKHVQKPKDM